jgi:hypothetical protein
MTIKDHIQSIVTGLGANFGYGRRADNNIQGDNDEFPMVYLIEPDEVGFLIDAAGGVYDSGNYFVQFLTQIEMGDQAKNRVTPLQAMYDLAAQFVMGVIGHHDIAVSGTNIKGIVLVDYLDVNATGVEISLQLSLTYPRQC